MMETILKLKTNLDTDSLKLVVIILILLDHVGGAFSPQYPIFRWLGRFAFPVFRYRLIIGFLCTHDIKRYFGRLALFAVISQSFYALRVDPFTFIENLNNFNIFFILILSLLFMQGTIQRRWYDIYTSILVLVVLGTWNFDYFFTEVILMLIFHFCRRRPALGCALYCLPYLPVLWGGLEDPLATMIDGQTVDRIVSSLPTAPLTFYPTHTGIKIDKWSFYIFYPAHLAVIVSIKALLAI